MGLRNFRGEGVEKFSGGRLRDFRGGVEKFSGVRNFWGGEKFSGGEKF